MGKLNSPRGASICCHIGQRPHGCHRQEQPTVGHLFQAELGELEEPDLANTAKRLAAQAH